MTEPRYAVRIEQIRRIDELSQRRFGIPELVLMEGAGLLAWQALERIAGDRLHLLVFAGKGNNGGDALVLARYAIFAGREVTVVTADGFKEGSPAATHLESLRHMGARILDAGSFLADPAPGAHAQLVVDGLAGSGIRGELRPPLAQLANAINGSELPVVSLDVPSGLSEDWSAGHPIVTADWTLELGLPKQICYSPAARHHLGTSVPVKIGFPPQLLEDEGSGCDLLHDRDLPSLAGRLRESAHKGTRGRVGVVGGSIGMTGAPQIAAQAALHARAGLVTIRTDLPASSDGTTTPRAVMTASLSSGDLESTLVIGPGWGRDGSRTEILRRSLEHAERGVVDADALHVLACALGELSPFLHANWVLTPHPGELAVLCGDDPHEFNMHKAFDRAGEFARSSGAIVVAKGPATCILHPDGRRAIVDGANVALATAGSGDALAGTIGGLLAGGLDGWSAARAGVLAHQLAGGRLRGREGFFVADAIPAEIGRVFGEVQG